VLADASSASTTFTLGGVNTTLTASFTSSGSGGSGDCNGEEKSLGSGEATNNYLPSYNYYNYSLTQQIYTASEIGMAGTINSISFYNGGAEKTRTYDIYLKTTAKTSFNDAKDWVAVSASDKVYTGSVTMTVGDWTTINFTTPFEYDGTSNLILTMDDNSGAYTSSPHMACRVYDAADYQAVYVYSDGTNYDPASPPTSIQSNNSTLNKKNQVKFCITPAVTASVTVTGNAGCTGQATTLTAHPSGDFTSSARYSWGGTGVPSPSSNLSSPTIDVTPPSAGSYTYTCTVTEGNLEATAEVTINVYSAPSITPPSDVSVCVGEEVTLTPSISNVSSCETQLYSWSSGESTLNITPSTSLSGNTTYTFTVTNVPYKKYDYIELGNKKGIVTKVPVPGTPGEDGEAIALTDDIATEYCSSGPTISGQDIDDYVKEALVVNGGTETTNRKGFYIPADATGGVCASDREFHVSVNANPTPGINGPSSVCAGGSVTLTATGGGTYKWDNNSTSASRSVSPSSPSSTYSVTVTGAEGCATSTSKTVTVSPLPTPTISQADNYSELTCSRTSITLTANGSGGTFEWYGGGTGSTNEVSEAGTYTVTETKDGCQGTSDGYGITSNTDAPTASISGNNEICLGESTTLETTSNPNYTYSWSNSVTTYTNTVTPTTITEYKVTTTDSRNGCLATASRTVTVKTPGIDDSSYDYLWRGVSTDWNTVSNWYVYSAGNYNVATSLPTTAKNIYIGTGLCLASSNWPSQTGEANANNITIASGASLTIPASKTLNIAGSITNNGTFTANNSSTIVFKGSATQTLSSAMTFGNVIFAQTALDTIKAPNGITVNGIATFTKGIVMGEMTFNAGATAANVTDSASFVAGKVTKHTGASAETNFTFPTGSAGDGQPKVLGSIKVASLPANSETYVVFNQKSNDGGFSDTEMPRCWNQNNNCEGNDPLFDHISNFEFWNVSTNSALTADLTVSANNKYAHFSPNSVSYNGEDIFGAMWQGGCWKKVSDHAVVSDTKTITISGVTIPAVSTRASEPQWLSMGSKNHETLLPIELLSFTATCNGKYAELEWSTASERNNDYFVIERSDDAINFTEVGRVAGAGNSIEQLEYSYNDYGIHGGDNYYRLVQVDYDGTRSVSDIVVAICGDAEVAEPDVQAFPNPFNGELTLELDNFGNRPATIEVYDMLGKLIYTEKASAPQNSYETILNFSNLPPAAYTVRVSTTDFVINKQVVKQ
jgi:hypothetical protein